MRTARLLRRLLPSQDIDALVGDITEEARHRPRPWYWAQLVAVIVVGSWRDIRAHKLVATSAVAVALVCQILIAWTLGVLRYRLAITWPWPTHPSTFLLFSLISRGLEIGGQIAAGWIVVRLYRTHGVVMLLPFLGTLFLLLPTAPLSIIVFWRRMDAGMMLMALRDFGTGLRFLGVYSVSMIAGGWLATRPQEAV
jgi:hypothetical protein